MKKLFLIVILFTIQFPAIAKWEWQNPYPTGATLNCVKFVDSLTGWVVGNYGQIFKTTDGGNTWLTQESGTVEHLNSITSVPEEIIIPIKPTIAPNPASDYTEICFFLDEDDFVELTLFSLTGERLKEITNEFFSQGRHCVKLDIEYSSGMYFVIMKTSNGVQSEKMIILN
ncbi:MAG: T9SS type A sorting domain-containing protein [Bacteroidetes bacterium]|nr:MAG: T9SS type A sorting domain-containing protein [Bacteroidota bacterium]